MTQLYFDIETEGFDFENDKIITIQYQELDKYCRPINDLIILKTWESSEEQIVTAFHRLLFPKGFPYKNKEDEKYSNWFFVPVMTNHIFDLSFVFAKFKKYDLPCPSLADYLFAKPKIDIKDCLVIANNYSFFGAGLDNMTNKKSNGSLVPEWFKNKEYDKIVNYIEDEAKCFLEALDYMNKILKELKNGLKRDKS
jgi:hypothetical protein